MQHGINVVAIVFNNSAFGNLLRDQTERYGAPEPGARLTNPDFVALAQSFCVPAVRVCDPGSPRRVVSAMLDTDSPGFVDVGVETWSETSLWPFLHSAPYSWARVWLSAVQQHQDDRTRSTAARLQH